MPLALQNLHADPLRVRHADLERFTETSPYRSLCPACKEGLLLVARDQTSGKLLEADRCCLCAQPVIYTDIDDLRAAETGTPRVTQTPLMARPAHGQIQMQVGENFHEMRIVAEPEDPEADWNADPLTGKP